MGEKAKEALKLQFDKRLRLEFHGARITSDGGLLACRELDGALKLTEVAPTYLRETRGGRNVQHELVPLLRQSVYSRLAGYEDTNDTLRLAILQVKDRYAGGGRAPSPGEAGGQHQHLEPV